MPVGILLGVLFACEFIFVYRGLLWTSASRAVMFLYTAPFFVALGAVLFLAERLSVVQWGGLALSFFGLVVAFGAPQTGVDAATLFGDGMMIFGAMFWAATTLLFKASKLARVPAEKAMAYQVAVSGPILGAVLTDARLAWIGLLPGAVFGGVCWWALQTFGSVFIANQQQSSGEAYGQYASIIALFAFLFLASQLSILGAEINVVRARRLWPRSLTPGSLTDADIEAFEHLANSTRQDASYRVELLRVPDAD